MSAYILSNALVYLKDILPITAGVWATFRISPDLERGLDINTWGVNAFFVLKSSTQIERYLITAVWGVATIVKRGLEQDGITENADLKKSWWDGSVGYITVKPDDFIALGKLDTAGGYRNAMGNALWMFEVTPSWVEVKRWIIVWSGVPADTALIQYTDPTTREKSETTYSAIKNSLATAWKYVRSIPLWEATSWSTPTALCILSSSSTDLVPVLTSDSWNAEFLASATGQSSWSAFQVFDSNTSSSWLWYNAGAAWVVKIKTLSATLIAWVRIMTERANTYTVQWSNDDSLWTTVWSWTLTASYWLVQYIPCTSTVAYLHYRITWTNTSGNSMSIYAMNFLYKNNIGSIQYANTLWSNIGWARVKSWIRFSVPYATTLNTVKTSQISSSASARVQLFADDGTTLIDEVTPSTSDTVIFPNTPISADTIYRLVVNDSTYFQWQNNELILATYQANMPFCVSWTLNWSNSVEPQNIKEVNLWNIKAMKAIWNSTVNHALIAWFVSWTNSKWSLVTIDNSPGTLISWFTWLVPFASYYIQNTAWTIGTSKGTIVSKIWYAVSPTEILINDRYTMIDIVLSSWAYTGTPISPNYVQYTIDIPVYWFTKIDTSWNNGFSVWNPVIQAIFFKEWVPVSSIYNWIVQQSLPIFQWNFVQWVIRLSLAVYWNSNNGWQVSITATN